ncbi:unnamed protein product, partial [Sphacelaria rigidula]
GYNFTGTRVYNNPWIKPPSAVVEGGWTQIVSYYQALTRSGATTYHGLKMVLIGAICAGKTTLARGLRKGKPTPTAESERTRGVDVHIEPWRPNPTKPLEVLMWDFAGHAQYYSTHQFFLTSGALYLLVVDLLKFHNDISHRGEALYTWLDVLLCRVPGCAVLVVATHADSFDGDDIQVAAALSFLEEEV